MGHYARLFGILTGILLFSTVQVGVVLSQAYIDASYGSSYQDSYSGFSISPFSSENGQLIGAAEGTLFSISTKPSRPRGLEPVTLTLEGPPSVIKNSYIDWFINRTLTAEGYGKTFLKVTAPQVGANMEIVVHITEQNGTTHVSSYTMIPSEVELLWSTETYVPPMFKGKALASYMAPVRVTAIPFIPEEDGLAKPETLMYQWSVNGRVRKESGIGSDHIDILPGLRQAVTVAVVVSNPRNRGVASMQINIPRLSSFVQFYEVDPIFGLRLERTLGAAHSFRTPESSIAAVPYYMGTPTTADALFEWSIDGRTLDTAIGDTLTLRPFQEERVGQRSTVSVRVTNQNDFMTWANKSIVVQY